MIRVSDKTVYNAVRFDGNIDQDGPIVIPFADRYAVATELEGDFSFISVEIGNWMVWADTLPKFISVYDDEEFNEIFRQEGKDENNKRIGGEIPKN